MKAGPPAPARVLIDASNLRTGGAVQVAASFVDELARLGDICAAEVPWLPVAEVAVSRRVHDSLGQAARDLPGLTVRESHPTDLDRWRPRGARYDVSFVVFGPEYGWPRATGRICGYADVRSVYATQPGERSSFRTRARWRARGVVSRWLVSRSQTIVVESQAFKDHLMTRWPHLWGPVEVVPNTYNGIFDRAEEWQAIADLPADLGCDHLLSYVTRPYPHKNLPFLPEVRREGLSLGRSIKFLTTLTSAEWAAQSDAFREACVNVGAVPVQSVPVLHRRADAAFFPSLLEAFSAMPLEVMKVGRVVFASDRDFVRTVCADAPVYIDPLDARSAAETVIRTLSDEDKMARHVARGEQVVAGHPTARDRARAYVEIINRELARQRG